MKQDDILYLVSESPSSHGVFDPRTETQRMVFCKVMSVTGNEYWRARENDIFPAFVFRLSDAIEYQGEKICVYNGTRYRIVRTYTSEQYIDLTVEEITVDAVAPQPGVST